MTTTPNAEELAAALVGRGYSVFGRGRWRGTTTALCHGGDSRDKLRFSDGDGGLSLSCMTADCNRQDIIDGLIRAGVLPDLRGTGSQHSARRETPRPHVHSPAPSSKMDTGQLAIEIWSASAEIPTGQHPGRAWLNDRNLWPATLTPPPGLRWCTRGKLLSIVPWAHGDFVGAVVTLVASPGDWIAAWPETPRALAVQLLYVDDDGRSAQERGMGKRNYGSTAGRLHIVGDPRPEEGHGLVVVEGVADALAWGCRKVRTAVATLSTGAMRRPDLDGWLKRWRALSVHADNDGGEQQGLEAAKALRRRLGGPDRVEVISQEEYKDAAEWTAAHPLPDVDGWKVAGYTAELAGSGLPRHEAERQAYAIAQGRR